MRAGPSHPPSALYVQIKPVSSKTSAYIACRKGIMTTLNAMWVKTVWVWLTNTSLQLSCQASCLSFCRWCCDTLGISARPTARATSIWKMKCARHTDVANEIDIKVHRGRRQPARQRVRTAECNHQSQIGANLPLSNKESYTVLIVFLTSFNRKSRRQALLSQGKPATYQPRLCPQDCGTSA